MVCVNFDVTELKQTEKNLIEAKNKAEVSDRLKSAFLANMSHEIRTPLNAIVGFSNLLAETDDIGERREYMRVVEENNELLLKLISDILDLSKIEAGTFEFNYGRVDVNRMCEETVCSLSLKVKDKPVELIFGEHDAQCCVVGDKNRLIQVITNFINNAVKFTDEGSITLGYRTEGGELLSMSKTPDRASPKSIGRASSTASSNSTASRRAPDWGFRSRRASSSRWAAVSASNRRWGAAPGSGSRFRP